MYADPEGGSKMLPTSTQHSRKHSPSDTYTLPPINSSKRNIQMIFEPSFDTNKAGK